MEKIEKRPKFVITWSLAFNKLYYWVSKLPWSSTLSTLHFKPLSTFSYRNTIAGMTKNCYYAYSLTNNRRIVEALLFANGSCCSVAAIAKEQKVFFGNCCHFWKVYQHFQFQHFQHFPSPAIIPMSVLYRNRGPFVKPTWFAKIPEIASKT